MMEISKSRYVQPSLALPRMTLLLCKISGRKGFRLPPALDGADVTEAEASRLAALEARTSWIADTRKQVVQRLRNLVYQAICVGILVNLLMVVFSLPMYGSVSTFLTAFFIALAFFYLGFKHRTSKWGVSKTLDWDVVLKNAVRKLRDGGVIMPPSLVALEKEIGYGSWPDAEVYRHLGPLDSLGMIRLAASLDGASSHVRNVVLDGNTEELLSRVMEVVLDMRNSQRSLRISAMDGLERNVGRTTDIHPVLGESH